MKTFITTTMALLALTVAASATDLPSKKSVPTPPVAAAAPVAASADSLSVSYGQDLGNNFGAKVDDAYGVTYKHSLGGGFSVGGVASTTQVANTLLKQNLEVQAGYALPAFSGVTVSGKVGVGERFTTTNFPYYALYGAADYKLMDGLTLNAISYRYRNAFDTTNSYESHRLGTGVTYDITSNYSVGVSVTRSYDSTWNATGDAVTGALTVKF
jgi:hypothetical protein